MPSIWKTLGLEGPTNDLKAIKRAYAAKLKVTRPEDDPEGFMALRKAMDSATAYARNRKRVPVRLPQPAPPAPAPKAEKPVRKPKPPEIVRRAQPLASPPPAFSDAETFGKPPADTALNANDIIAKIDVLISDTARRQNPSKWANILQNTSELDLLQYSKFETALADRLLTLYGYEARANVPRKRFEKKQRHINPETLKAIYRHMGWNRAEDRTGDLQAPLTWLIYESGILKRPKSDAYVIQTWRSDAIAVGWRLAIIAMLWAASVFTDPQRLPEAKAHPMLPLSGETLYGRYETDRDAGQHSYTVNANHPEVKALIGYQVLNDSFQVQYVPGQIEEASVRIARTPPDTGSVQDLTVLQDTTRPEYSAAPAVKMTTKAIRPDSKFPMMSTAFLTAALLFFGWCFFFFLVMLLKYLIMAMRKSAWAFSKLWHNLRGRPS